AARSRRGARSSSTAAARKRRTWTSLRPDTPPRASEPRRWRRRERCPGAPRDEEPREALPVAGWVALERPAVRARRRRRLTAGARRRGARRGGGVGVGQDHARQTAAPSRRADAGLDRVPRRGSGEGRQAVTTELAPRDAGRLPEPVHLARSADAGAGRR